MSADICIMDDKSHRVLIFNHIPKCGGSSIEACLKDNFGENCFKIVDPLKWIALKNDLERRYPTGSVACYGYATIGIHTLFPDKEPHYLAFFREPFDRTISLYNYLILNGMYPVVKFNDFIDDIKNPITRYIAGELDISLAKDRLKSFYSAIGILEEFGLSLQLFANSFSLNINKKFFLNKNPINVQKSKFLKWKDAFYDTNKMDLALYDYAKERFYTKLDSLKIKKDSTSTLPVSIEHTKGVPASSLDAIGRIGEEPTINKHDLFDPARVRSRMGFAYASRFAKDSGDFDKAFEYIEKGFRENYYLIDHYVDIAGALFPEKAWRCLSNLCLKCAASVSEIDSHINRFLKDICVSMRRLIMENYWRELNYERVWNWVNQLSQVFAEKGIDRHQIFPDFYWFLEDLITLSNQWTNLKRFRRIHKVALYGAGKFSSRLERAVMKNSLDGPQVVRVFDDLPTKRYCFGLPVEKTENVSLGSKKIDAIVVSAVSLRKQMKIKCERLFGGEFPIFCFDIFKPFPSL